MLSKIASSGAVSERLAFCKREVVPYHLRYQRRKRFGRRLAKLCLILASVAAEQMTFAGQYETLIITDVVAPPKTDVTRCSIPEIPHGVRTADATVKSGLFGVWRPHQSTVHRRSS